MDQILQDKLAAALAPAYEIEGELGRGGMAVVYRARDTRLKRPAAIKLLPPELAYRGDIRSRFLREAETAARLSHPNIVPIYAVDERDGLVFFVMALVDGESVGERIRRAGPMPASDVRRILREVADALAYAHAHGVIHRDVKPDNILLDRAGGRAMVTDFGIARAASDEGDGSRLTATGAVIGTPSYMSPEQCAGDREVDGRSDLYSLGTVAYQMLTGEPPFIGGNTPAIMMKQVTEAPVAPRTRRGDVPEDLDRIVMKLLAKSPADRFADGAALIAALDGAPVAAPAGNWGRYNLRPEVQAKLQEKLEERLSRLPIQTRAMIEPLLERGSMSREDWRSQRRELRAQRRGRDDPARPMSERIRRFHGRLIGYTGTSGFLFLINALGNSHSPHPFWWALFPIGGMGLGLVTQMSRLIGDGATVKQLLGGRVPPEADRPSPDLVVAATPAVPAFPPPRADQNDELRRGPYGGVLVQAMTDRQTVNDLLGRLTETERQMLPEMKETADALFQRIVSLAAALTRLGTEADPIRVKSLDDRIAELGKAAGEAGDRERRMNLLKRQRESLNELVTRRGALLEQYESAGLLLQNMALDLLKVRSSGLDSAINGLTSATQEARALSREIGYVLAAGEELKRLGD